MSASAWRWVLLVFCLIFMAQEAWTIPLTMHSVAVTGVSVTGRVAPFRWSIAVGTDSPAYKAGLRTADVLDAASLSPAERFRLWSGYQRFGEPVRYLVVRNGAIRSVTVMPNHTSFPWELWLAIAAGIWTALCAIVLVWRKAESRDVRLIVLWLLSVRLSIQMGPPNAVTPSAAADALNNVIESFMFAGWVLLVMYAASFPAGSKPVIRILKIVAYAMGAFTTFAQILAVVAAWYGFTDPEGSFFTGTLSQGLQLAYFVVSAACVLIVFGFSRGQNRERLAWIVASSAVYCVICIAYFVPTLSPWLQGDIVQNCLLVAQLFAPIGLTYAMLNRRLLDIGFVLNRAAVFAGVSIVVVGIFVLVEWAFGEWFGSATHAENVVLSGALALALGLSIRAIHLRVDRLLDAVFFRKRHEDEEAIRRFAREAPYITDAGTLVERTVKTLETRADAAFVSVLTDGIGRFGDVSENDEAIVSLRASHRVLDLSDVHTAIHGEFAYPMVARGRLIAVLVLGPKNSGESYAPDEAASIEVLANSVAGSLDVLDSSNGSANNGLASDIKALRLALQAATENFNEATTRLTTIVERLVK